MSTTLNDIAARLGISKSTVSKALHNATDISEATKRQILQTAAEMGYISKLQRNNTRVCIIIENMDYLTPHQFGYDIVHGFCQMAEAEGWHVDIIPMNQELQHKTPYDVFMLQEGYQASLVLGFSLLDPWMAEFRTTQFPTVLYDNHVKDNPRVASVGCSSEEGFEQAIKHLVKLGHKKIGLISGPLDSYIVKARYQAYLSGLTKYGLEINDDFVGLEYYVSEAAKRFVPRLFECGVTAILCSHDIRAISVITECRDREIRVPYDMSVVGFDDLPMAAFSEPPLTTIRQDRLALGKCSYYAMTSLMNHVPISSILLRAQLIVRDSTGPAHPR